MARVKISNKNEKENKVSKTNKGGKNLTSSSSAPPTRNVFFLISVFEFDDSSFCLAFIGFLFVLLVAKKIEDQERGNWVERIQTNPAKW